HGSIAPVELAPLLEEIVYWYTPIAQAKGIRFLIYVPAGLAAWGHTASLRRALHEVVDNAVRYGGSGTVTLAATLGDGLAAVGLSDEGSGIPDAQTEPLLSIR